VRVLENGVLRKIVVPGEGGSSRRMERMHNADCHGLNIRVRISTRMR
jgi:hypothetical protein